MAKRVFGKLILYVLTVAVMIVGTFSLFSLNQKPQETQKIEGVFEIWHIEAFEGGATNRAAFLNKTAALVTKKHPNAFFVVKTLTKSQVVDMIDSGKTPDLLSFSYGIGNELLPLLKPLPQTYNCREDLAAAGFLKNQLALPYIMGGYALVSMDERVKKAGVNGEDIKAVMLDCSYTVKSGKSQKTVYSVAVGSGGYNNPYSLISGTKKDNSIYFANSQYEAYEIFSKGQSTMLLGTQRDLARLENKISQNTMPAHKIHYFDSTDLLQFIGISAQAGMREQAAQFFVETLFSVNSLDNIHDLGMLATSEYSLYNDNELMFGLENALNKRQELSSVFMDAAQLKSRLQQALGNS